MEQSSSNSLLDDKKIYVFLVLACLLAYANSLSGEFLFDDTAQIVNNQSLHSWRNLFDAFTTDVWAFERSKDTTDIPPPYYRPLFTVYLTIGYQIFGLWQQGWHLLNLGVHIGVSILVYRLFLVLTEENRRLSFIGAIFFALIPVHVESVTWISGIPDPLAALFYIPAILFYIRRRRENNKKYLIFSLLCFFFSLLCKETPIVLPAVLFLWEITINRKTANSNAVFEALKNVLIFIVPIAVYLLMRFSVLGRVSWRHPIVDQTPTELIYATVPYVFTTYLKNLIFPFNLSLIYSVRFVKGLDDALFWLPVLILIAVSAATYYFRSRLNSLFWFAVALLIIPLLPVLNLPVFHYEYIVQDRYLYLPSIGFVLLVAFLLEKLWTSEKVIFRQAATATAVLLCLAYVAGTVLHNRVWTSSVNLWTRVIEVKPESWSGYYNLALANYNEKDYESAVKNLTASLDKSSFARKDNLIYNNRGLAQQALGRHEEAKKDFLKSLEKDSKSLEANVNLGVLFFEEKKYSEAEAQFRKVLQIKPNNVSANYNLALTLAKSAKHKEAIEIYSKLLQTEKRDADLMYHAAISFAADGQNGQAVTLLKNAAQFVTEENLAEKILEELKKLN